MTHRSVINQFPTTTQKHEDTSLKVYGKRNRVCSYLLVYLSIYPVAYGDIIISLTHLLPHPAYWHYVDIRGINNDIVNSIIL